MPPVDSPRESGCKNKENPGVAHRGGTSGFLEHVLYLSGLQKSGIVFHLGDLTPQELLGLAALREAIVEISKSKEVSE